MADQIVVLDEQKMLEKIHDLPNQLEKAWTSLWTKDIGVDRKDFDRILIAGMGGSGIAGYLAKELCLDSPVSIDLWADYELPGWVNDKTLFIAVSYSGDTEETLDATKKALEKKAQIIAITSGGKLKDMAKANKFPVIEIDYKSSPREAIGWLYGSVLTLLAKLGVAPLKETDYFKALKELHQTANENSFPTKAQELVMSLNNKVPVIATQKPLTAVAKRWVNELNENAKTFAVAAEVPELCHNLLVGLDFAVAEKIQILYLESHFAFSRNVARRKLIEKLCVKKEIAFTPLSVRSGSLLAEQLLFIYFGDLLSYYLAGVYGIDPSPVESINFLKEGLKKA